MITLLAFINFWPITWYSWVYLLKYTGRIKKNRTEINRQHLNRNKSWLQVLLICEAFWLDKIRLFRKYHWLTEDKKKIKIVSVLICRFFHRRLLDAGRCNFSVGYQEVEDVEKWCWGVCWALWSNWNRSYGSKRKWPFVLQSVGSSDRAGGRLGDFYSMEFGQRCFDVFRIA